METDLQIKEIAYQVGFQSLTYFNRVFLKKKKMTPREFRESIARS
ncbi:MAG: helix-turn-helix domain-containing protein [Sphingobacteriales bacterium]